MNPKPNDAYLELILLLAFLIPAILFLLTQHKTLKAIRPENRRMKPGLVWLQLIPFLNLILQFIIIVQIARSIRKERIYRMEESLMNSSQAPQLPSATYPTLGIGIAYAVLSFTYVFFNLFSTYEPDKPGISKVSIYDVYHPGPAYYFRLLLPIVCALSGLVCWIVYWVSLYNIRKELSRTAIL